jgi:cell division protein FtsI (penicillin-binding protein 3)
MSASPLHLAAAYAAIANGGVMIKPTLLKRDGATTGVRVMSEETAAESVKMLRRVVVEGTATLGEVPGYEVAGKTGTADKPKKTGGYYDDKVINTFAAMFPASNPQYVLIVTLDEPLDTTMSEDRRTAGWTAVPVAAEIIRRVAPLMGLRPKLEPPATDAVTAASN